MMGDRDNELCWIEQTDTNWLIHRDDGYTERYVKTMSIYPIEEGKPMFGTVKQDESDGV